MKIALFGDHADSLRPVIDTFSGLDLEDASPDAVICYGGDGTLLAAELKWPATPKVPIRNSERGARMMDHPPSEIIERLEALMKKYHGDKPVILRIITSEDFVADVRCPPSRTVTVSTDFCTELTGLLGPGGFELCGAAGSSRVA